MLPLPRRHSLIAETAAVLRQRIEAGEWPLHLPGELDLAALLQVGRNTVRSALAILESEGYLATANGARRRITKPSNAAPSGKNAVILMSRPERDFPPATAQWIEGTRARLESSGWILRVSIEPEIYRGAPAARLEKMTQSQPGTTWILHRSTPAMQRWFQEARGTHRPRRLPPRRHSPAPRRDRLPRRLAPRGRTPARTRPRAPCDPASCGPFRR
jgi:LacI family transcriptional regulator